MYTLVRNTNKYSNRAPRGGSNPGPLYQFWPRGEGGLTLQKSIVRGGPHRKGKLAIARVTPASSASFRDKPKNQSTFWVSFPGLQSETTYPLTRSWDQLVFFCGCACKFLFRPSTHFYSSIYLWHVPSIPMPCASQRASSRIVDCCSRCLAAARLMSQKSLSNIHLRKQEVKEDRTGTDWQCFL